MSHLPPAYRGAPYHQPRPPSRRHRALRIFLLVMIATGLLLLFIIIGAWIAPGSAP